MVFHATSTSTIVGLRSSIRPDIDLSCVEEQLCVSEEVSLPHCVRLEVRLDGLQGIALMHACAAMSCGGRSMQGGGGA